MNRLEKQFAFLAEIDKMKNINRQSYVLSGDKKENDAEHSWHLALFCLVMQEYAKESIDMLRVMSMVLIHDLVEIDAGDTYAYDIKGNQTKRQREQEAAERIFSILPEDQAVMFRSLWDEFEARETAESKFANTLDRVQPIMLNHGTDGKAWLEHGIALSQVLERNKITKEGSDKLWDYAKENFIMPHVEKGHLKNE